VRAEPLQAGDAPLLPPLGDAMLARVAQSLERNAGYSLRPRFSEATAECGALARQADHPLVRVAAACGTTRTYRRILARFIELVDLPDRMTRLAQGEATGLVVRGLGVAPGRGIAGVETARGLLVHEAKIEGDRIAAYRIVAPTEWNFHPDGALVADLNGVAARTIEEIHRLASLAIQSLDPCVRFEVRVRHA
jgi:coenzyme F420-reducing hydrogenase alpha subunit